MSIVLKALEKAQKEKTVKIPESIIESTTIEPLPEFPKNEESAVTIIRIEEQPTPKKFESNIPKPKPFVSQKPNSYIKIKPHPHKIFRKKIMLLWGLLGAGIIGLMTINSWIIRTNPGISDLKKQNKSNETISQSKIDAIKNIILEPNPPQLKITGVMWDNKEPMALINGKCLKQGDEIEGAKIVNIQQKEISVLFKEKKFTISVE